MKTCPICGQQLQDDARFCSKCGARIDDEPRFDSQGMKTDFGEKKPAADGVAVYSLIGGILSAVLGVIFFAVWFLQFLALGLGISAVVCANKRKGVGIATAGKITGIIGIVISSIVVGLILIGFAIGVAIISGAVN